MTPPEPLHGYKLGICKYLFEGFETQCSNETMRLVNFTAMRISKYSVRSSVRNLPSLQAFKRKGLSKCNTLSADEQYARIFCLFLCLLIPNVIESLAVTDRKDRRTFVNPDGSETIRFVSIGPMGFSKAKLWLELVSQTVSLNSWIMNPFHSRNDLELRQTRNQREPSLEREARAQKRLRKYMLLFKTVVDRTDGNGLCIPKFHQLLHYVQQILKDGSLLNVDGGRCESIAIVSHTNPGKRTQMRMESYLFQLAKCHYSDSIINEASRNCRIPYGQLTSTIEMDAKKRPSTCMVDGGSRFVISLHDETCTAEDISLDFVWLGKQPKKSFSKDVCLSLGQRLWFNHRDINCLTKDSSVIGFTEYTDSPNFYRAHPSYRDSGEWFDWCTIDWDTSEQHVPCKLMMFLDFQNSTFCNDNNVGNGNRMIDHTDLQYIKKDLYVLIQSCLEDYEDVEVNSRYRCSNSLCTRVRLEQSWRIVPLDSIREPAFVIPEDSTQLSTATIDHFAISPKDGWQETFLSS